MGVRSFLDSCRRILKLSKKPDRGEYWIYLRVCLIGLMVIGFYAFIIALVSSFLQGALPG